MMTTTTLNIKYTTISRIGIFHEKICYYDKIIQEYINSSQINIYHCLVCFGYELFSIQFSSVRETNNENQQKKRKCIYQEIDLTKTISCPISLELFIPDCEYYCCEHCFYPFLASSAFETWLQQKTFQDCPMCKQTWKETIPLYINTKKTWIHWLTNWF